MHVSLMIGIRPAAHLKKKIDPNAGNYLELESNGFLELESGGYLELE